MTDLGHIERASSEIERLELGETSGDVARERVEGGRLSKADGESKFLDLHAGIDRSSEGDLEIDKLALFVPGIHLDSSEGLEAGDLAQSRPDPSPDPVLLSFVRYRSKRREVVEERWEKVGRDGEFVDVVYLEADVKSLEGWKRDGEEGSKTMDLGRRQLREVKLSDVDTSVGDEAKSGFDSIRFVVQEPKVWEEQWMGR